MRITQRPVMSAVHRGSTERRRRRGRHLGAAGLALHPLEPRVLLTAAVTVAANGKSATYLDIDGDAVTVAVSAGTLMQGDFFTTAEGLGLQLDELDLSGGGFGGANISVTDKRGTDGDGLANVGYINATGQDLGTVSIIGDLGRIDCGDATTATPGLKSLSVRSMGRLGLDSQNNSSGSLATHVVGALSSLTVKGDMQFSSIIVSGGADGSIGTASIGGSLIGGSPDHSGELHATGAIGTVKIGGDLAGSAGLESGAIVSSGAGVASVAIGGSILGSSGDFSGFVGAGGLVKSVTVGGDLRGRTGMFSGAIESFAGSVGTVTLGGSMIGNSGVDSAAIVGEVNIGLVKVAHNIQGSSGGGSGLIQAQTGAIAGVTVGGSLLGSSGSESAYINSTLALGAVAIKHDVQGSSGDLSGGISGGTLAGVVIGGSLVGGSGDNSGQINAGFAMGNVSISGDIHGGSGEESGAINGGANIGNVTVGGSLLGGSNVGTGMILAEGGLGAVKIGLDVHGGSADNSGLIWAVTGPITGVSVGGSVVGGSANQAGVIVARGDIGAVTITGSLLGGGNAGAASISATGAIISNGGRLASVTIGGSILAGGDTGTGSLIASGAVMAENDIGALTVKGSLIGIVNATASTFVTISARGQGVQGATTDVAMGKITIGGRVQYTNILGGYDVNLNPVNADAQIGTVTVGGDWAASNLVAGVKNSAGPDIFGNNNDALIFPEGDTRNKAGITAQIASITIKGYVYGTPATINANDNYGFVAQSIKAMSIAGIKLPAHEGPGTLQIPGTTGDVDVHQV